MALSILNNIPSLVAEDQLNSTQTNLQKTLYQLASGSRINSGADDAAGLAIADSLQANTTALTQSEQNANNGVGMLQVADGALSQVTSLLNRAVTLATEASTDTVNSTQRDALNAEFTSIKQEITNIGTDTTFNNSSVFTGSTTSIFMSDANSAANSVVSFSLGTLGATNTTNLIGTVDIHADSLAGTDGSSATTALSDINSAIAQVASMRGTVGANINQLQAANNVMATQVQNLTSAQSDITSADIASDVSNMSKYNILEQTGMAALAQANSAQQAVLKLLG